MRALRGFVVTLRPEQWTKNLVLFAGLIFAGGLGEAPLLRLAASGFLVFCALSGATYVLNDLVDVRSDREHPDKRTRPLASGELPAVAAAARAGRRGARARAGGGGSPAAPRRPGGPGPRVPGGALPPARGPGPRRRATNPERPVSALVQPAPPLPPSPSRSSPRSCIACE